MNSRARAAVAASTLVPHPPPQEAGPEWKVGSVQGEAGTSLSVRLTGNKAGVWSDFSTGESWGTCWTWAAVRCCSVVDACEMRRRTWAIRDEMPPRPAPTYKRPARPQCGKPKSRVLKWLLGRGLTEETIAAFKIGEQERGGKTYAVFPTFGTVNW